MSVSTFLSTTWPPGIGRAELQSGTWDVAQVATADVRCLAVDRVTGTIYAGTQGEGVLSSADGGRSWEGAGLEGQIVKSLATTRAAPGTVWAGTKPPHLWVSSDSGSNWRELDAFRGIPGRGLWLQPAERPSTAYVSSLTVSPTDPDLIVAGMEAGAVVRSADGGATWTGHRKHACRDCHNVTFHARDGSRVYEAGGGVLHAGVALSTDGGDTWARPEEGLDAKYGWAVAADVARPEVVFVSLSPSARNAHSTGDARAHIYRRIGNEPWRSLAGGLPEPFDSMVYALISDEGEPGHLYAGTAAGDIYETQDMGDSWASLDVRMPSIHRTLIGF